MNLCRFVHVILTTSFLLAGSTCQGAEESAATDLATAPADMKLAEGFQAELIYVVPRETQGSWVSLTVDDKGRLIASDQYGKLYRITPPPLGASRKEARVEPIDLKIGMAHGLLFAFDNLYVMVNGPGSGLYRVRDTDGDDQFDDVELLRRIHGSGEHGPHAIVLSPDGKSLYVCGGNHTNIPHPEKSLVPRNWQEDLLLGRQWDARGHAAGKLAPGGWICRTDPQGKEFTLVSIGYRNEYDIAFNADGELFTYDADMEWDIGTPWYRPTRVNHATSGSEFGWRSGTGKWPAYYPDSLPAVVNVGPGSPTGIAFGTGARFPAKYQRALFLCDWSYGVIYAVHLQPKGATYQGTLERFCGAAPLPATDLVINPHDGAMYFTIGGRRAPSALYRVSYVGEESTAPAPLAHDAGAKLRKLRHKLEAFHGKHDPASLGARQAIEVAWPHLGHPDRFVQYAARIAVEHQPVEQWRRRVFGEKDPRALIAGALALARCGAAEDRAKTLEALSRLDWAALPQRERLNLLRAYGLAFLRLGDPDEQERAKILAQLSPAYPADNWPLNRELSMVLIYLEAPEVVERTLDSLAGAPTQEAQIHYAFALRNLKDGWTLQQRREYFDWFNYAASHRGGASFGGFLENIRKEAVATLSGDERVALRSILEAPIKPAPADLEIKSRPFVKKWTVEELAPKVEGGSDGRDLERGRRMFSVAACYKCHRFNGQGGTTGPDLTAVGRRFAPRVVLEAIIEPDKVISDQYESTSFLLADGRTVTGRVVNLSGNDLMVITDMLNPGDLTSIKRDEIEAMKPSTTSLMPSGLVDTLTEEEILDLMAFLRFGGQSQPEASARLN